MGWPKRTPFPIPAAKSRAPQGRKRRNAQPNPAAEAVAKRIVRIEAKIAKGPNSVAIFQDLVEHHGYEGAYNAVKRFVRKIVPAEHKVRCRFETDFGQEAQVDYGEGAPTLHPQTGKYRKPRLFVMSLGCSVSVQRTPFLAAIRL